MPRKFWAFFWLKSMKPPKILGISYHCVYVGSPLSEGLLLTAGPSGTSFVRSSYEADDMGAAMLLQREAHRGGIC